jgi:hypothetical protein
MDTIDRWVPALGLEGPFGIKIDTEGYELEVIRGAAETLRSTAFVIAEVTVSPRFHGSYSFPEFVSAMAAEGFSLCDILATRRTAPRGITLFVDAMFRPESGAATRARAAGGRTMGRRPTGGRPGGGC